MDVRSAMYNLNGKRQQRDYLSAEKTILPRIYFLVSLGYFFLAGLWISILHKKRLIVFRIHFFMLAVLIIKALNLLCEAEDKSYIKRTGNAHGWDMLFYIFSFLKGITLFTLIVLIGTGWSFLKPYLQDKEKKVLMIVIPLQVVANIAYLASLLFLFFLILSVLRLCLVLGLCSYVLVLMFNVFLLRMN